MNKAWSPFGYETEPETPGFVRVCLTAYPWGGETTTTVDMPEAPRVDDTIHLGHEDLPPVRVKHRAWVYEPDIRKWHLECSVD